MSDDDFIFMDDDDSAVDNGIAPWLIAVIDDEPAVFEATHLALDGLLFDGRKLKLIYAPSAKDGRDLLLANPDICCVLLDVVMETDHAGLDLAREIREVQQNHALRIILRTGQPGYAPPMEVIERYQINDYKEKTELTRTRLFTALACGIRSYQQISALEQNRKGLQMIIESSSELMRQRGINDFSQGVLTQLAAHLGIPQEGLLCVRQGMDGQPPVVVGAAGRFAKNLENPIDHLEDKDVLDLISQAFRTHSEVISPSGIALYLAGQDWKGVIYLAGRQSIGSIEQEMLRLFCSNVALGYENVRLFQAISDTAYVDRWTYLSTRFKLEKTIENLLVAGQSPRVLLVEIDHFDRYEAQFSFDYRERLLRGFAQALLHFFPHAERLGRLQAGCFAVVILGEDISDLLSKLVRSLDMGDHHVELGLSLGLSGQPHGVRGFDLIEQAELALSRARTSPKGTLITQTNAMESERIQNGRLAQDIYQALRSNQLGLAYLPQRTIHNQQTSVLDVALHWKHPVLGAIEHHHLLSTALDAGFIGELGQWIISRTSEEIKAIGLLEHGPVLSFSLVADQITNPVFWTGLVNCFERSGLTQDQIELCVCSDHWEETLLAALKNISLMGYKLAINQMDLGTTPLNALLSGSLQTIRIPRGFVLDPGHAKGKAELVRLWQGFGLKTVACDINNASELEKIKSLEIDSVQGEVVTQPLPAHTLKVWLDSQGHV